MFKIKSILAEDQPQLLYFEGNVTVDIPIYTIAENSVLYFAPGAELRVASGSYLSVEFAHLRGCEEMWRGIALEQGSELYFVANTIEDAQYAIEALGNCDVSIFGNLFTNNYVGIYKAPSVDFFEFNQPFPMAANRFSMEGVLLPPYPGQLPDPGQIGLAGIELHDTKFLEVGAYALLGVNEFSLLRNGIIADNATIFVINGNFRDISGDFDPTNLSNLPEEGVGIVATDRALIDARDCEFDNMIRAVHTVANRGDVIKDNVITNVEDGIVSRYTQGFADCRIIDNEITNFRQFGIHVSDVLAGDSRLIADNVITSTSGIEEYPLAAGILLAGGAANLAEKEITGNQITLNDLGIGISVQNAYGVQVLDNVVSHSGVASDDLPFPFFRLTAGLDIRESALAFVKGNIFTYDISGDPLVEFSSGILGLQCPDASFCCNTTDGHPNGTQLYGMFGNAEYRSTTIEDHGYGLRCRNGTAISTKNTPATAGWAAIPMQRRGMRGVM